ncbi:MAG: anti-phage ZorAB system protein ZorA [Pseudomonadota bacterium]
MQMLDMRMLENLPQHIFVFAFILGALTVSFVVFFLIPAFRVSRRLSQVIRKLEAGKSAPHASLAQIFGADNVLAHLWREYSHTLHEQTQPDSLTGESRSARWRSTVPAETLFRAEIIVDTPLHTEFFRHLPGLFTGVGIIGTFFGLLMGLRAFEVSENPVLVRDSLNSLLHGVWEAFLVSAAAIALAMVVTLLEKLLIARLYAKVERLVQALDGLFEAGAGEEYLARLVHASESGAGHTTAIKGELVVELKQILTELSERQIAALSAGHAALGERISQSVEAGLKAPLAQIAEAFRGVRTDQSAVMQDLLNDVVASFGQHLKETFGDQITGINTLQQKTIDALRTSVVRLEQMGLSVESAGQRGASAMAERLGDALVAADARQREMNSSMTEFVEQIRLVVSRSQGETHSRLQETLDELSKRMGEVITALSAQVRETAEASRQHHDALAGQTTRVVGEMGGQVEKIADGMNRAVLEMKAAVEAMRGTTSDALSQLDAGAKTVARAAADFAQAGQSVNGALDQSNVVAERLASASHSVADISSGLTSLVGDYQAARSSIGELVGSLQSTLERSRKETLLADDVLARIESATAGLAAAQRQADTYLSRVSEVIVEAHGSFSQGVRSTLEEVNTDFHRQLSDAVKLLRLGIEELQATLETAAPRL